MNKTTHIAIFASGSGTNAEQIMTHFADYKHVKVKMVLSNKEDAGVLERAEKWNVPSKTFTKAQFIEGEVQKWLEEAEINVVVLAGFVWKIPSGMVAAFEGRMVNIHPSLLPAYGGKGMFGNQVHEAVKAAGEKQTGITIHLVNENYDEGAVLFQARTAIDADDTPADIAQKVHLLEHQYFPRIIDALCKQI
ncbi:MAG: phosphoribosylglycinamide formyltransferase-1 [Flavobacteriales bacterium]|jgi:phosphoribosylglycinamide formyltransferase-1